MNKLLLHSESESATDRIGEKFARELRAGDVLSLNGELGAGKTRLVRAIVSALHGSADRVNSPTFVIVQRYPGSPPVDHVDAYRLADADEFLALGGEDLFAGESICLIEWADRIADVLPDDHLRIDITATAVDRRQFCITASGTRSREIVAALHNEM